MSIKFCYNYNMDVKLSTLITVAEMKNFTQAARKLKLTQPAVSQHIKRLEREYNIVIFQYINNELTLTPEGELLYKYARRIEALYLSMESRLLDLKNKSFTLKVGVTHTSESNAIIETLAEYSNLTKGITIKVSSDTIKNLYEKIKNYELDLAIVEGKITDKKLSSILLDSDSLLVAMSKDNPLSKKKSITIENLKKQRIILRSQGSETRNLFLSKLKEANNNIEDLDVVMEIDNIQTIKDLVKKGVAVSILPKSACLDEIANGSLVLLPIENMTMVREINILYQKEFIDKKIVDEILEIHRKRTK